MLISNLENVKKEIQAAREGKHAAWIFKNGKLADDIIAIDALEVIAAFAENIVNTDKMPLETQKKLVNFICENAETSGNTCNYNGLITNDMNYNIIKIGNYYYTLVMFHLGGDIRGNYTDYLLLRFEEIYDFFSINETYFTKGIGKSRYDVDMNIFSEKYSVWDNFYNKYVGEFYEIESGELLKKIIQEV